jgi:general secretion pathway protein B
MSIILDALNKSSPQSSAEPEASVADHDKHVAANVRTVSWTVLGWLGAMLLTAFIGVWFGWSWREDSQSSEESRDTAAGLMAETTGPREGLAESVIPSNKAEPIGMSVPMAGDQTNKATTANSVGGMDKNKSSVEASSANRRDNTAGTASETVQPDVVAAPTADPAVVALYQGARGQEEGSSTSRDEASGAVPMSMTGDGSEVNSPEEAEIDIEEVLLRAQAALGEEPLSEHPTPLLEDLSQRKKDSIPTVVYSQHDWNPGESTVVLNGELVRAGQRVGGIYVVEILSDSVVLRWQDTEFRLRALNSWINL